MAIITISRLTRSGGREQRAAGLRITGLAQPTQALDRAADGQFAGRESDAGETAEATLGNGGRWRLAGHQGRTVVEPRAASGGSEPTKGASMRHDLVALNAAA